jgi:hypothetical protein
MAGIADFRLLMDMEGVATLLLQSTIGNQPSKMKTWSLVAAVPRCSTRRQLHRAARRKADRSLRSELVTCLNVIANQD